MGYPNEPGAVRGSETSEEAAATIASHRGSMNERIIANLNARGPWGATSKEVGAELKMKPQTVSARFAELRHSGGILRTLAKRTTQGQYRAYVYISAEVSRAHPGIEVEESRKRPPSDIVLRKQIEVIQHDASLLTQRMDEYLWADGLKILSRKLAAESKKLMKMLNSKS